MSDQRLTDLPPGFEELTVEDKIDYVHSLWDRILRSKQGLPVPDWHRQVTRERQEAHQRNPEDVIPWETVRAELEKELPESE